MNGEEKLRTVLTKTGIPTYEWPSLNGQVSGSSKKFTKTRYCCNDSVYDRIYR